MGVRWVSDGCQMGVRWVSDRVSVARTLFFKRITSFGHSIDHDGTASKQVQSGTPRGSGFSPFGKGFFLLFPTLKESSQASIIA